MMSYVIYTDCLQSARVDHAVYLVSPTASIKILSPIVRAQAIKKSVKISGSALLLRLYKSDRFSYYRWLHILELTPRHTFEQKNNKADSVISLLKISNL